MSQNQNPESKQRGVYTLEEIRSQAESWNGTMDRIDRQSKELSHFILEADTIVFTGCGSAFNVSHALAPVFQRASGLNCRPVHASDMVVNSDMFVSPKGKTLVVAISRSGSTTESVMALRKAASLGCRTISIVCFPDSPMAQEADMSIVLEEASEKSVTTTRSLTSMVLCGQYLSAVSSQDRKGIGMYRTLPDIFQQKNALFEDMGERIAKDPETKKYAFVGSGSYYGLAREAQLKIKEMVLHPSDSYVTLDFQHGPMSNVDSTMLVSILVSDSGRGHDLHFTRNMEKLEGKTLVLCDSARGGFSHAGHYVIELDSNLPDGVRDILYMPPLQFMAYYKSMDTGNDPDNPKNLHYYVEVESFG